MECWPDSSGVQIATNEGSISLIIGGIEKLTIRGIGFKDKVAWFYSRDGLFSIKLAY